MVNERSWHTLEAEEVLHVLESDRKGLSKEESRKRLAQFGPNALVEKGKISPWAIFIEQFKSLLIIILLIAVVLSAVLGEVVNSILIAVIVVFACGLGFIQEYRAERAMEALKKMSAPIASVLRDGKETEVPSADLVPGDIILLRTGDRIPADARLIEAINLKTDEALLTGESVSVEKTSQPLSGEAGVSDRKNMVFMGTAAVYGRSTAVVTATGMATEFGKIATMLQEVKQERTPLQINLDRMGRYIGIAALALCFVLAGIGILRGHEVLEMFIWGVALAVAAVPEALPAVVVISLALGVRRMVKRHALIRRLPAVETLGSTTFICSDKTGTLTQDRMTVQRIYVDGRNIDVTGKGYEPEGEFYFNGSAIIHGQDDALHTLLKIGALCNDTSLVSDNGGWKINGDPTEGALVVAAAKTGLRQQELNEKYPRIGEIPFSSETKRMTTIHQTPEGKVAYSKGASEVVLNSCSHILIDGKERKLTDEDRNSILSVFRGMADDALRILGMAYKRLPDTTGAVEKAEQDMVFVGLSGMIDPPREEVKEAIKLCDRAGIKSVMITGDYKLTAVAIARELGLFKDGIALTGAELDNLSDKEFEDLVEKIEVYARVSPAHKLRVVGALVKKGQVVAMTGDGINDAPALKKADIGVAMGITGTDVTREAADMVLTDDNFASIVAAVEEGRAIFGNIKKYLMYLLSSNIGEILLMTAAILLGPLIGLPAGAIPLIAIQILFVNLVTDGLPAIALSVDPADPDIMEQKPRPRGQGIFTGPVMVLMLTGGIWSCLVILGVFKWALDAGRGMTEAQALCFLTLIIIQFFKAYNFRSDRHSIFKIGLLRNRWLNLAVLLEFMLLVLIIYMPFFQGPFHTFSLSAFDWLIVLLAAGTVFPVLEITKLAIRWWLKREANSYS
ncbi:MAG: cation-translocating P-type ATPase [Dehalococcoidales bacterium]|nr:cation-translocating P-type ATPase [Dehalococcoidales bacterium]